MPTDPPHATHTTGPNTLGHAPQTPQRVPAHQQPLLPPYSQINHRPPYPQHPPPQHAPPQHPSQHPAQHVPNGAVNPMQPSYPAMPPRPTMAVPMHAHGVPPAQPARQQHLRQQPTPFYIHDPRYMNEYTPYSNFVFANQPFYPTHPNPNPQAPPPHTRPPPPQHPVPQSHQPPSRVAVREKKVLAIVDPDTKKEIKVSKAEKSSAKPAPTPAPPTKIKPPTSRPLSLVPDPADRKPVAATKTEASSKPSAVAGVKRTPEEVVPAVVAEAKSTPSDSKPAAQQAGAVKADVTAPVNGPNVEPVKTDSAVSQPQVKRSQVGDSVSALPASSDSNVVKGAKEPVSVSPKAVPVASQPTDLSMSEETDTTKADDNLDGMTSDVSSTTFPDVRCDSADNLPSQTTCKVATSTADTSTTDKPTTDKPTTDKPTTDKPTPMEDVSTSTSAPVAPAVPNGVSTSSSGKDADDTKSTQPVSAAGEEATTAPANDAKTVPVSSPSGDVRAEEADPEAAKIEAPMFTPGQRRVYAPAFMHSMRSAANPKKAVEYQSCMSGMSAVILKRDSVSRNDARVTRSSRSGSGPMTSDPRHSRAFPGQGATGFPMPSSMRHALPMMSSGDDVDLGAARMQHPPAPKAPPGRDGDPRGVRSQGPVRSRFDGPTRQGQAPIDPFVAYVPPVEKLKTTDRGWKRNKDADDEITAKVKQVRSLLNKLTIEKFDRIFQQIVDIDISSAEALVGVVKEIFEKTLFEPKFSNMYAELCRRLDETIQPILNKKDTGDGKKLHFRRILVNNCKEEFTRFANSSGKSEEATSSDEKAAKDDENKGEASSKDDGDAKAKEKALAKEEAELNSIKAKRRMLANVRFIGELFLKDLLTESIIHKQCIQRLLHLGLESKEEDVLEAVCKLISKTGEKLALNRDAADHITRYFQLLQTTAQDPKVPARIRFMIQDLVEQRANNWKVRREEVGAKTIAEIHKEVEREEKAKVDAQNALRERKRQGPGGGGHGRGGVSNYQPRVAMTMANRPNPNSGMSRSLATLERMNRATPSTASTTMPLASQMRLGPGSKGGMHTGVGGAPALRPNGSRASGSRFTLLGASSSDSREGGSMTIGSGDVRRSKLTKGISPGRRPLGKPDASSPAAPSAKPAAKPPMDPVKLKRKSRSILEEFWGLKDLSEAKACVEEEVFTENYAGFVDEVVKLSIESNKPKCELSCQMFAGLVSNNTLPPKLFKDTLDKLGPQLLDTMMDFPLAAELFAIILNALTAVAEFRELEGVGLYGASMLSRACQAVGDAKTACKLVAAACSRLFEQQKDAGEEERKALVKKMYKTIGYDLSVEMVAWDPMVGLKMLKSTLERSNIVFIVETLDVEMRLREVVEQEASVENVGEALRGFGSVSGDRGVELMQMTIRVGLDAVFVKDGQVEKLLKEVFNEVVCAAVAKYFGEELAKEVQMGALYATQTYFARNEDKLSAATSSSRVMAQVCHALYERDIAGDEEFMAWRDDTEMSGKLPGKEKMVIGTSGFFKWLTEAEEE